jgi:hypothetical protein
MWLEWTVGINGGPSIEELELGYPANKWRSYPGARQALCARKVIISAVQRRVKSGLNEEQALAAVKVILDGIGKKAHKPNFTSLQKKLRAEVVDDVEVV